MLTNLIFIFDSQQYCSLAYHSFLISIIFLKLLTRYYNTSIVHNKMAERKDVSINMPEINSSKYKMNLREIQDFVKSLNNFTNNLQEKVGMLLKGQETEFVNSYKNHMKTVEEALNEYQQRISEYQKKIEYYQNQGVLSTLLNKITFLETTEKKLLDRFDKKDRVILDLKNQISTQNKQISSLHERIKQLLKSSTHIRRMKETSYREPKESERTFATEIPQSVMKSNQSLERIGSEEMKFTLIPDPEDKREWKDQLNRARHQVHNLKKRNRQLSSVNSRIIDKAGQVDQFFIRILNQLKRKITTRKHFAECTFEDFKQEDKLQLLVKVLSNEEVLQHLYQKIFRKQSYLPLSGMAGEQLDTKLKTILPVISTSRRN